jgi:hypothetical protein
VEDHAVERDDEGNLLVTVRFRNVSDETYVAKIQVRFLDEAGRFERASHDRDVHRFEPGPTTLQWRSYTPHAGSYVIEVRSALVFQW